MTQTLYLSQKGLREMIGRHLYLSGPMAMLEDHGAKSFTDATAELRALGWDITSPHELAPPRQEGWTDKRYHQECLRLDLQLMLVCDGICLLDNWWMSVGAMIELNAAIGAGLTVVRYMPTVGVVPA